MLRLGLCVDHTFAYCDLGALGTASNGRGAIESAVHLKGDQAIITNVTWNIGAPATIYRREGTAWVSEASVGSGFHYFGISASVSGDWAVVGSPNESGASYVSGKAYLYHRTDGNWSLHSILEDQNDTESENYFGWGVDVDGDYLVVTNNPWSSYATAFVYQFDGTLWTLRSEIDTSGGYMCSLVGDRLAVGGASGPVLVFRREGDGWLKEGDFFTGGGALELDQQNATRLIIGNEVGSSADVFRRDGTVWTHEADLFPSDGSFEDRFGHSVAIHGDYGVVGAPKRNGTAHVYVFQRLDSGWVETQSIPMDDTANTHQFGEAVGISGGFAVATYLDDIVGVGSTIFSPGPIPDCDLNAESDACQLISGDDGDCNNDLILDSCDADCNASGTSDVCDLAAGDSDDCNFDGIPDECQPECNGNGVPDECDITVGASLDCNVNAVPDECDLAAGTSGDCNANAIPDECEVPPIGPAENDCNGNAVPDECDLSSGASGDCQGNGVPDECDLAEGASADVNDNDLPDECEPPTLLSAASVVFHTSVGELAIDLPLEGTLETDPRIGGGKKFMFVFEGALDPALALDEANILFSRFTGGTIEEEDMLAELDNTGLILSVTFPSLIGAKLADEERYTVDLTALQINGDAVFEFRLLAGDVNGDAVVDPLDSGAVLSRFSQDPAADPRFDVNNDGLLVDPLDAGAVLSRFSNSAP